MSNTGAFPWKRPNLMRLREAGIAAISDSDISRPCGALPPTPPSNSLVCGSANRMKTKTATIGGFPFLKPYFTIEGLVSIPKAFAI